MQSTDENRELTVSRVVLYIFAFILSAGWMLLKIAFVVAVLIVMVLVGLTKPQKNGYY